MATHIILEELTCWHTLHFRASWIMPPRQSLFYSLSPLAWISSFIFVFLCVCVCVCVWQEEGLCTVVIVCARMMCVLKLVWQEEWGCKLAHEWAREWGGIVEMMGRSFWAPLAQFELLSQSCSPFHQACKNDPPRTSTTFPLVSVSTFSVSLVSLFESFPSCTFSLISPLFYTLVSFSSLLYLHSSPWLLFLLSSISSCLFRFKSAAPLCRFIPSTQLNPLEKHPMEAHCSVSAFARSNKEICLNFGWMKIKRRGKLNAEEQKNWAISEYLAKHMSLFCWNRSITVCAFEHVCVHEL